MFNDLSIQEKAAVIKLGIGSGLRSLQQIEDFYNSISEGGDNASSVLVNRRSSGRDDGNKRNERRMTIRDWLRGSKNNVSNTLNNMMYVDNGGKPYVNGSVASMDRQPWVPSVNPDTGQVNSRPDTYYYDNEGQLHMYPGNYVEPVKRMSQDEIADFFWQMENPNNVGLNQDNGMYYKYRDPNDKDWDVGPGLVIGKAIDDKPYYTKDELDRAAYRYHMDAMDKLAPLYDEKYGYGAFGNIDDRSKLVASDVMYRVGQNGVTPSSWPSMFDAINSGNTAMMLQQSRSKFKDGNNVQNYDNARVKRLGEYLYPGEFEYIFRNSLDPNIRVRKVEQKKNGGYLSSTGPEYIFDNDYYPEFNEYKKGGSIHIKPENRGKFTALKKRTGHSASWFKAHGTPAQRKMATFALNARKWHHKHAYGGPEDPPKNRFKTPEEILAEKYGIEPMVMDNVVQQIPVVTQQMKNEYASTPQGLAEQFGTIGQAENTNAFQRKVREIRNSDNPMLFGAYFVSYLGQGMLLSNAAERVMSGQYGQGLFDAGLAFAPYLSNVLRNTWRTLKFNSTPMNIEAKTRMNYPWQNWNSTTELSPFVRNSRSNINPIYDTEGNVRGWQSIDGNLVLEAPKSNNINSDVLFENNFFNLKPYTPEWTENGIGRYVDPKGMINRYEFENLFPLIEKDNFISYHDPRTIFNKNQGKRSDLLSHSYLVAKTAKDIPLPKDVTRQEMVFSALMHDIGKTINPKETHGQTSARLVNQLIFNRGIDLNSPEYVGAFEYLDKPMSQTSQNAKIFNAIYRHMDADSYQDKYPEAGLLQALRFADVSRGLSYDQAAAKYPHLLTYDRDLPVMHKQNNMSFRDDLKYKVNPALKALKLQTVDLNKPENEQWEQLENIISEYRTFLRGARDPQKIDIFNANKEDIRNSQNASFEAYRKYGADTPENRTRLSAEYIPIDPTGSGRMGVFDVSYKDELPIHRPGTASKMVGINPKTHDVDYVSTSNTIANTYKQSTDNRTAHAYFVELPFEKHVEGEMPSEFMLRSDYDMYDIGKLHHGYPLGTRSMYEIPYRLQTGKSLQQELKANMPDDIKPQRIGVVYPSENATPEEIEKLKKEVFDVYQTGYDHILDWMDRSQFSEEALKIQDKIDNYYKYESAERSLYKVNNKLKNLGSSFSVKPFEKNGMINKQAIDIFGYDLDDIEWLKGMISDNNEFKINYYNGSYSNINKQNFRPSEIYNYIENAVLDLVDKGYITQKQKHSIFRDYKKQIKDLYNQNLIPGFNVTTVDQQDQIYSQFIDKIINNVKKYVDFDLLTSKVVKKYIENAKKKQYDFSKISKYLKDPERQLEFLREHDVTPRFELPSFNQQIVLANQMPKTPKYQQNQIIHAAVLGKKGEKVLNVKDILDESLLLKRKQGQGRDQGEVLPFGVSKKTYKLGGLIKPFSYLPIPEVRY